MPCRTVVPEAVLPCSEYAVATNASGRPASRVEVERGGAERSGGWREEQPAKEAATNRPMASVALS